MTTNATPATETINPDCSINRLVIALWNDAERKARHGDKDAERWLFEEGALWLDIILSVHPDHTRRYLRRVLRRRKPKANPSQGIHSAFATGTPKANRARVKLERMPADRTNVYA